ncbi:MAG TPA: response regulator [Candidatus Eisenbacteria bacterium]|nr:response regulator [Candidatus Eisenbacteria bacterium]
MITSIVIVDDHDEDVAAIRHAFEQHRVTHRLQWFVAVDDAFEFLLGRGRHAQAAPDRPHLVLLDVESPRCGGFELLERIRREPRLARVPVVLLSRERDASRVAKGYELGANSFVVKPPDLTNLAAAIRVIGLYWMLNEPPVD